MAPILILKQGAWEHSEEWSDQSKTQNKQGKYLILSLSVELMIVSVFQQPSVGPHSTAGITRSFPLRPAPQHIYSFPW